MSQGQVQVVDLEFGIGLLLTSEKKSRPYFVDFLSSSWKSRWKGLGKGHIFRKALGAHKMPWRVLDLTAGFGQDAMMAVSMGCDVVAIEKNETVYRLLSEGVERARIESVELLEKLKRFELIRSEAKEFLQKLISSPHSAMKFDAIYLDPMFEKPKKSAKSPKEMQLLQGLVGASNEAEEQELLNLALQLGAKRVVVKRPLKGQMLKGPLKPSYKGQSVRYDIY